MHVLQEGRGEGERQGLYVLGAAGVLSYSPFVPENVRASCSGIVL